MTGDSLHVIEGVESVMDTSVAISVAHSDVNVAKDAIKSAFLEMRRIEDLMSVFKRDSEVYLLNKDGFTENASEEVSYVIERARYYSKLSDGAFAVTVLPLLNLWKKRLDAGTFPTEKEVGEALSLADYRNVKVEDRCVRFLKANVGITLGGIAKGYAVDRTVEVLKQKGVSHALVNAGGDIKALGDKTPKAPWKIGVRDPREKNRLLTIVNLRDMAIATSGGYERFIGRTIRVPHIINARTGYPAQGVLSATVIAKDAIDADALSTIVFLLGPEKGMEVVERLEGVEALIITEETMVRSTGFHCYEG